jgi:hypothetical protein
VERGRNLPRCRTLIYAGAQMACEACEKAGRVMATNGKRAGIRAAFGILAAGLLMVSAAPASAQNIFERIFSGLRQAVRAPSRPPVESQAFVDPFTSLARAINPPPALRSEAGPARAFCVRTCDGRYFPVQAHAGLSAAEACRSFCPASQTRLYSGGNIDYAAASDGSRYADLDNAFVYRKQLVAGCTCNGRDAFGLAQIDAQSDPTLRPGDIVATKTGLMAFTGGRNKVADFTPIDSYRGLNKGARDKLSEVKIMPPNPGAPELTTATIPPAARGNDRRRVQLER